MICAMQFMATLSTDKEKERVESKPRADSRQTQDGGDVLSTHVRCLTYEVVSKVLQRVCSAIVLMLSACLY